MGERTLGEHLQTQRRKRELTVAQVAEVTKINPYYLRAMERDELHLLPPRVYVRGYIRSLGQVLGLEVADLYSMLPGSEGTEFASAN